MPTILSHLPENTPGFVGVFETHITVAPLDAEGLHNFETACAELGVKCVRIELARGETRSQPMTGSHEQGTAQASLGRALELVEQLEHRGFRVTRVKIEAGPMNTDLPETDAEATKLAPTNYFEGHIKLLLPESFDAAPLLALIEPHEAHLSRNAFKRRDDGLCERFVTLRGYGRGRTEFTMQVESLLSDLRRAGYPVVKSVAEYCIFDSNEQVDAGWLRAE